MKVALAMILMVAPAFTAAYTEKNLQQACGTCHPLDPVRAARLSRADWNRELDKMQHNGAQIKDRKVLLDYLVAHYGPKKVPIRSALVP